MQVVVTVTGLDRAEERLTALGNSLHDFSEVFEGLGKSLILFYGDTVFNSEGQALGETWTPLSDNYAAWKSKHWPGRGMLEQTGEMRRSFTSDVTPDSLFVSNDDPIFTFHQQGTGANRQSSSTMSFLGGLARSFSIGGMGRGRNLPARPMIGVNATVEGFIRTAIEGGVKAKIESTNI